MESFEESNNELVLSASFFNSEYNFSDFVDFDIPMSNDQSCENVVLNSDNVGWDSLDLDFFEGLGDNSSNVNEVVFNVMERQGGTECGEQIESQEQVESEVEVNSERQVDHTFSSDVQVENISELDNLIGQPMTTDGHDSPDTSDEAGIEELVGIPRFELRQWSSDVWKSVPHKNVFVIKIKEGTDHFGPGWWADFPLAQQDVLRAEVVSEYNLQSNGVYKIQGRICFFNDEFTLVLVSTYIK